MRNQKIRLTMRFVAAVIVALVVAFAADALAIEFGVGSSQSKDARAAAVEAAKQAAEALGDRPAKLVLVFHNDSFAADYQKVLDGVGSVFDADLIYGANAYAALTHQSNDLPLNVLAVGGDVQVTAAVAKTEGKDDDRACGARIGLKLKEASEAAGRGRVMLLFGDCHVPRNNDVTQGVLSVLGDDLAVLGGASFKGKTYAQGKPVAQSNVGILITGDFRTRCGMMQDNSPEGLIRSARQTVKRAAGKQTDNLALMFVFDCGGRRGMMVKNGNFPAELAAIKEVVGDTPIFGFFGSGEIGRKDNNTPACGDGHHIAAGAIIVE